jgi:hypothetical protein
MLTATALPTQSTQPQVRSPLIATLAGVDEFDLAGTSNIAPAITAPSFVEVFSPIVPGFSQTMDVVLNQTVIPPGGPGGMVITIYASNGPGSVEAAVAKIMVPPGLDGVTAVLRKIQLPVASAYRVSVLNNTGTPVTFPLGISTYSTFATAGTSPLTPAVGDIGVTGPANANAISPTAPLEGEAMLTTAGAATWQSAVGDLASVNPYWNQATWFVDPQNSTGLASDTNSGIDALHPVLTFNGGIATKWGTYSPRIRQSTTLTWLSSQVGPGDPVVLMPVMDVVPPAIEGVYLTITGALGPAQEVGSGILAGVVPKNRPAAQLLNANLGAALLPGTLLFNSTKGSYAWVYELVSGTTYAISQPMAAYALPIDLFVSAEDNTWSNGDAFVAYEPISINVIQIQPTIATYDADFLGQIQAIHVVFSSISEPISPVIIQNETTIAECRFDTSVDNRTKNDVVDTGFANCYSAGGYAASVASDLYTVILGGVVVNGITSAAGIDYDAIINCGTGMIFRSPFTDPAISENSVGTMYIAGKSIWSGTWDFVMGLFNPPLLWGPGVMEVQAASRIFYSAPAAAVFINTGGLQLDDQSIASTFNTSTNLWSGPFALSAAALDNPAEFNGLALDVANGGGFSSQATP